MKYLNLAFIFFAVFLVSTLNSQNKNIVTDRPGKSDSPLLIEQGLIQAEIGASIEKVKEIDTPTGILRIYSHSYPAILLRYGIAKDFELRLDAKFLQIVKSHPEGSFRNETGFSPLTLGTKVFLNNERGIIPQTALLLSVSIPFKKDPPFQSEDIGTEFRLAMTHNFSNRFALIYNTGAKFGSGLLGATGIYTISLYSVIAGNLSAFAELYGYLPQKTLPDHRFDSGLIFRLLKNFQVDISYGLGLSEKSPDFLMGGGVSFRLPK